jgi:alkylation response protein AidB-like acyl-CoA dehydrogenase
VHEGIRALTGRNIGAISYGPSEREAGSDPASMKARAVPAGDGWVLSGEKPWITNGAQAVASDVAMEITTDAVQLLGVTATPVTTRWSA